MAPPAPWGLWKYLGRLTGFLSRRCVVGGVGLECWLWERIPLAAMVFGEDSRRMYGNTEDCHERRIIETWTYASIACSTSHRAARRNYDDPSVSIHGTRTEVELSRADATTQQTETYLCGDSVLGLCEIDKLRDLLLLNAGVGRHGGGERRGLTAEGRELEGEKR